MNQDMMINRLAHTTSASRKQVIESLRKMSQMFDMQKELRKRGKGR